MASLQEIRRLYEKRNAPLLAEARAQVERLTDAIALGTLHSRRCKTLRDYVQRSIRHDNATELRVFLELWAPAIDAECRAAERAATLAHFATPFEPEVRPAHYTLGAVL